MNGVDWSVVRQALSAILLFGTVALGIYGLGRSYRNRARGLTKSGKAVAALMVMGGVGSFALSMIDNELAARKDARETRQREAHFSAQMERLQRLADSLTAVQGSMVESLAAQRQLSAASGRAIRLSSELQEQERQNTARVLHQIFDETNRVTASMLSVEIAYVCDTTAIRDFGGPFQIVGVGIRISRRERERPIMVSSRDSFVRSTTLVFHNFFGDLSEFRNVESWRQARVSFRVVATQGIGSIQDYTTEASDPPPLAERLARNPSCPLGVYLALNGRRILRGSGTLRLHSNGTISADMDDLPIEADRLPRSPAAPAR